MKKEYLPMAMGFWGVAVPLVLFAFFYCRTTAQRVTVFLLCGVFVAVGWLIYRAKQ